MIAMPRAELFDDAGATLGEGPAWDAERNELTWVDILGCQVHVNAADGTRLADHPTGEHVGAALPTDDGWLLALRAGFALLGTDGTVTELLPVFPERPELRFNDAKCDPHGRAWAGTMRYDEKPDSGVLYRLDGGPRATPVLTGQGLCNGMGWSPDGGTFYYIDTLTRRVTAFERDQVSGDIGSPHTVVEIPEGGGGPDGMCVDDEGCLWVALFGGGAIHRYRPNGELVARVELPATQVTSCCFGGSGRDLLFATTAAVGLDDSQRRGQPHAGGLFVVEPGVTGPGVTRWRGAR